MASSFLNNRPLYRVNKLTTFMSTRTSNANSVNSDEASVNPLNAPVGGATVLKCEKLSKSYTGVNQLNEVSFQLGKGKHGLVF